MSIPWTILKKYITLETILIAILLIVTGYFLITSPRKKYPFLGIPLEQEVIEVRRSPQESESSYPASPQKPAKKEYKHEERCREIFSELFGVPFKSVRPAFLKNPATGRSLEIDGYNPDIITPMGKGLGFEYDGQQHSNYVPRFHPNGEQEFNYQVHKDKWKDAKLKKLGILLIRIPSFVTYGDLERFIRNRLKQEGMNGWFMENRGISL